jgi:hypothetical protein
MGFSFRVVDPRLSVQDGRMARVRKAAIRRERMRLLTRGLLTLSDRSGCPSAEG